ncbi:hypothetical protein J6590_092924 [Homalodisca vitripennis]|nr:hypothetical protein J6590_092924 [Homalodisca vitripennis]
MSITDLGDYTSKFREGGLKKDLPNTPPSLNSTVHLPADIRGCSVGFLPDWQTYPLKKTILSPPPVDGTGGTGLEPR